eukprot:CAMPEP_0170525276 /NCGR_PEP_ID=MMETSP0209-20121228/10764_1 /TAXON_ID=665100 ORGANISM="Litonotus pictus, Strain P1" /NCGR_SAMPLE_ID=MMETSP0209 /ASSEMBLY_ACC=CAM_ASM_000301 /LENGTH=296 /DNA_ID=CAMNT_0010814461 /DNA_START=34 /DNA_END=924 /DNA_ORIENTATION=+
MKEILGDGTYGVVYRAVHNKTGEVVAFKVLKKQKEEEGVSPATMREISLLKELNHVNIIKLIETFFLNKKHVIVFEFAANDLKKLLDSSNKGLDKLTVKKFLYQLIKGMQYIHKNNMLHRDLKPGNLLLSETGVLKIGDFGLARGSGIPVTNYSHEVVTLWYRAPDVLLGNLDYMDTIDIWSIGCIFAEMITGKALFQALNEKNQVKEIFRMLGTPKEKDYPGIVKLPDWKEDAFEQYEAKSLKDCIPGLEDDGLDLLKEMLRIDPSKRIPLEKALAHRYFDEIREGIEKEIYQQK